MKLLLSLLVFTSALFADNKTVGTTQHEEIAYYLRQFLPNKQSAAVLIGVDPKAVEILSEQYRYQFLHIVPLDFQDKESWRSIVENKHLGNQFDCFFATNILEREANREDLIRLAYDLLKPGGRGFFSIDGPEADTLDGKLVDFIRSSKWAKSIPLTAGLTIPEYRELIVKAGFSISEEAPLDYRLNYESSSDFERDSSAWIGSRLGLSYSDRSKFLSDFTDSLRGHPVYFDCLHISCKFHSHAFLVTKP